MTKSEFVDQVAARTGLGRKDAANAVEAALQTIQEALERGSDVTGSDVTGSDVTGSDVTGSDVTFSGFGKCHVVDRGAREGTNPATGERIQIAATRVPRFTPGSGLKKAIKGG